MRRGHGNEELRPIRIRTGIGHGQLARDIKLVRRALGLVLEAVSRSSHAVSSRVSPLNHEIGNHTVKNRSVVELLGALFLREGMRPLARAFGKFNKIGNRLRSFCWKQAADNLPITGIEDGIGSGWTWHDHSLG